MVPGGANETAASTPSAAPAGGLAGAIQNALDKRKKKVSGSGMCESIPCDVIILMISR
jgi:neural Wiskott-Aldrich syndrome protein